MREVILGCVVALCGCSPTREAAAGPPKDASIDGRGAGTEPAPPAAGASANGVCVRIATHSVCDEMVGKLYANVDHAKLCKKDPWAATCPTDYRLGACQLSAGAAGEWISNYYSNGPNKYDAAKAQEICKKALGTWRP